MDQFVSRDDCLYTDTDSVVLQNPLPESMISDRELEALNKGNTSEDDCVDKSDSVEVKDPGKGGNKKEANKKGGNKKGANKKGSDKNGSDKNGSDKKKGDKVKGNQENVEVNKGSGKKGKVDKGSGKKGKSIKERKSIKVLKVDLVIVIMMVQFLRVEEAAPMVVVIVLLEYDRDINKFLITHRTRPSDYVVPVSVQEPTSRFTFLAGIGWPHLPRISRFSFPNPIGFHYKRTISLYDKLVDLPDSLGLVGMASLTREVIFRHFRELGVGFKSTEIVLDAFRNDPTFRDVADITNYNPRDEIAKARFWDGQSGVEKIVCVDSSHSIREVLSRYEGVLYTRWDTDVLLASTRYDPYHLDRPQILDILRHVNLSGCILVIERGGGGMVVKPEKSQIFLSVDGDVSIPQLSEGETEYDSE
ncbi:hypothetical protein VPH35_049547 [Triticum aestivum]|uniref:DNA-directed DNA polymerase n=1 Tax=Triticum aestivum TaxID=4565 RepID=A0A077RPT8_WHEAT|nr:unnamed protein product [Triticum aestivum]